MAINLKSKPPQTGLTVAPSAIQDGRRMGLAGSVDKRLLRMARRSAPITHEAGNLRFDAFVLRVEAQKITAVTRI